MTAPRYHHRLSQDVARVWCVHTAGMAEISRSRTIHSRLNPPGRRTNKLYVASCPPPGRDDWSLYPIETPSTPSAVPLNPGPI